ncbi:MAG: hypothetical protein H6842_02605 [Rhodospirillaceae bacterium]|nr:hypothetical protein [Rhodospirillaceae bacterium]
MAASLTVDRRHHVFRPVGILARRLAEGGIHQRQRQVQRNVAVRGALVQRLVWAIDQRLLVQDRVNHQVDGIGAGRRQRRDGDIPRRIQHEVVEVDVVSTAASP